jgi:dolichol-phosphate mannosyltransferase
MNKTIIVVPTFNEIDNIFVIYEKIFKAVENLNLLIVDDNSPDGTGIAAEELAKIDNRVFVIHRKKKLGLGSAYIHGMKYSIDKGFDFVVAMDADLSHDPVNLPRMIKMMKDYDLVIGSRYVKDGGMVNWGAGRFFISRLANFFCKSMLGIEQEDCSGGYKCYQAELLKKIDMDKIFSFGYSFQVEILYRALRLNAKVIEIPIVFINRHKGESKLSAGELLKFGWTVCKLRWLAWFNQI